MTCKHIEFETKVGYTVVTDTNVRAIQIQVRCRQCGVGMKGLGLSESNELLNRPSSHNDGLTVTIPMVGDGEDVVSTEASPRTLEDAFPTLS